MPYALVGLLAIFLPLITYFSEQGWYRANKEALQEKQKSIVLSNEAIAKQVKMDESIKVLSDNNEKAIKERSDFEQKQVKLDQDFKFQKANLEKEYKEKFEVFNKNIKDKEDEIADKTKIANQALDEAKKALQSAKVLEEAAEKQLLKNKGDGETILKLIEDLKSKTEALSKNCDNHEKTDDPFFVDIIEKRISDNYNVLSDTIKNAKNFNMKFNNKTLAKSLEIADNQLNRAAKKVRGINQNK